MLIWVYTCQNTTLLEITCRGSNIYKLYNFIGLDIILFSDSDKIMLTMRVWMVGGGGGGSGIHYSLKYNTLFISLKFWVIH